MTIDTCTGIGPITKNQESNTLTIASGVYTVSKPIILTCYGEVPEISGVLFQGLIDEDAIRTIHNEIVDHDDAS